jgi:hypothetical protein
MGLTPEQKEAVKAYKARKPQRGIYAVRCTATGRVWVGSTPNLGAARNRLWFSLNGEMHTDAAMQTDWAAHGEQAFEFETLEKLKDDVAPLGVADLLKEKKEHWLERLGAVPL